MVAQDRDAKSPCSKEQEIFESARKFTAGPQRDAYVRQASAGKPELQQRVMSLLKVCDANESFLESPPSVLDPPAVTTDEQAFEMAGTLIGPYKLLQKIGEGGMGIVFMAEQTKPVQRKVALKVIKPGMDSKQVIARFEAERQALAMMDHVNIARVFDGGTTESGRPYFVMELVHGIPITKYCDDNHLTPRERLELFIPVCQAIQHAHQKGVIHRDIKPSNVLVTLYDGKPVAKVIDFGVAKATEQKLTERTMFTNFGMMVGTLEYMSPEQAEMSALGVDTRSDIYSLGVLLYELLTGSTPISRQQMKQAAFAEVLRIIKEEEPLRPSNRLSTSGAALATISAQRKTEPTKLTKLVRGELDWIVMKTLEKDRNRRYETASGLARDIERYLSDESVEACPPTAGYRLRKFVRRNKAALITCGLVAVALLLGTYVSLWQMFEANSARHIADLNRQKAVERLDLAREVVNDMYSEVADKWLEEEPEMEEVQKQFLLKALAFYEKFAEEKNTEPSFRSDYGTICLRIGNIHRKLENDVKAEQAYSQAIEVFQSLADESPTEPEYRAKLVFLYVKLSGLRTQNRQYAEAESKARKAVALANSLVADFPRKPDYRYHLALGLWELGNVFKNAGQPTAAEKLYQETTSVLNPLIAENPDEYKYQHLQAGNLHNTAQLLMGQKHWPEARQVLEKAIALELKIVSAQPRNFNSRGFLANHYGQLSSLLNRLQLLEEALQANEQQFLCHQKLANDFPNRAGYQTSLIRTQINHGKLLVQLRRFKEAGESFQNAIQICRGLIAKSPANADYRFELSRSLNYYGGGVMKELGRYQEAEASLKEAVEQVQILITKVPNPERYKSHLAAALHNLGIELKRRGAWAEAIQVTEQAIQHQIAANPSNREFLRNHYVCLAGYLVKCPEAKLRDPIRAIEMASKVKEIDPQYEDGYANLGIAQYLKGDYKEAITSIAKGLELSKKKKISQSNTLPKDMDEEEWKYEAEFFLAMAHWQLGEKQEAKKWYDQAIQWMDKNKPQDEPLRRFRAEATELMKDKEIATTPNK